MKNHLRWWLAGLLVAVAGCDTVDVSDGETPDPAVAYVVVVPHLQVNGWKQPGRISGGLTRLDESPQLRHSFNLQNHEVQIIKVTPGRYYLSDVKGEPLNFEFKQESSEFVAKAGQLNYPGDWYVREAVGNVVTHGSTQSVKYRVNLTAVDRDDAVAIAARFPALSKRLPLVHTRVIAP